MARFPTSGDDPVTTYVNNAETICVTTPCTTNSCCAVFWDFETVEPQTNNTKDALQGYYGYKKKCMDDTARRTYILGARLSTAISNSVEQYETSRMNWKCINWIA